MDGSIDNLIGKVGGAGGLTGVIISFLLHRNVAQTKKEHDLELAALKTDYEGKIAKLESDLRRAEASGAAAWVKLDDLRDNVVRKAELKEYREEIRQDIRDLGERLEKKVGESIEALRRELKESA